MRHRHGYITLFDALVVDERMAETLAQLHENVVERASLTLPQRGVRAENCFHQFWVLGQYRSIHLLLNNGHADRDDDLRHRRQECQDLSLSSPQEERPDHVMQLAEERAPGGFENVYDVISKEELDKIGAEYKAVAGFEMEAVNQKAAGTAALAARFEDSQN